jgi:hypothetical protein
MVQKPPRPRSMTRVVHAFWSHPTWKLIDQTMNAKRIRAKLNIGV